MSWVRFLDVKRNFMFAVLLLFYVVVAYLLVYWLVIVGAKKNNYFSCNVAIALDILLKTDESERILESL